MYFFFFFLTCGRKGETECMYNALGLCPSLAAFWLSCKCCASCDIDETGCVPFGLYWKVLFLQSLGLCLRPQKHFKIFRRVYYLTLCTWEKL